ncbi:AAA family ATPase [Candidatus Gracilibacteria bacterium]|nr:AAA family ATPase [Candidatus Gracilibacteria bacterium]
MDKIIKYSIDKIWGVSLDYKRYLYNDLVDINEKIVGVVGLRGVGKTTLLLQIANQNKEKSVYFSMDSVFVKGKTIFEIVEELYNNFGFRYFFIDEVHKYKNWEQDLKTLYDFFDDIKIYFSGSSSIDLIKGNYDLSRRGLLFHLNKFSFREFLYLRYDVLFESINLEDIFINYKKLSSFYYSKEKKLVGYFKEYLLYGELGFTYETDEKYYNEKFGNIINKIIYEDISSFYRLKTENIYYFFEILKFIANSSPSDVNYSNIAKLLQTTPDTIKLYINILVEIGLLNIFGVEGKISVNLRKTKKILFELTAFLSYFSDSLNIENTIGTLRESFVVSMLNKNGSIFYPEKGDLLFVYNKNKYILEIGGKNKTLKQIKNVENSFLIKDDIEIAKEREIPIWLFGFIY